VASRPTKSVSSTNPDHSTGAIARRCGGEACRQRWIRITSTRPIATAATHMKATSKAFTMSASSLTCVSGTGHFGHSKYALSPHSSGGI
jgi:hypothetical protein